jgi:large subunit ribosomal protein L33
MREWIFLECPECKVRNYRTCRESKGKKLELKKYCRSCRKHVAHVEKKK